MLPSKTDASISSCSASVLPNILNVSESGVVTFNVTNNDDTSDQLMFVKIVAPSSNFIITHATGTNEGAVDIGASGQDVIIRLSSPIAQGGSGEYNLTISTGSNAVAPSSFTVLTSDVFEGDNPTTCTGETNVSIVSPNQASLNISNVSVSVNDVSAIITWTTSINSTGEVVYGTTSGYGSTKSDTTSTTSHTVTLTGLSASTTYHFRIYSTDTTGNTAQITDNTFTTSAEGQVETVTRTITSTTTTVTTVREVYKDVILPSIKIKSDLEKVYKVFPEIDFVASDDSGISRLRYSIDGGQNWLPISIEEKIGKKQIASTFEPYVVDDGEYSLIIEVTDAAGNKNVTKSVKITIDRLSPILGPLVVMAGPQIINTEKDNILNLITGTEYKFLLSAAGGPNNIKMFCGDNIYDFQKNIDSGVWFAKIKFDNSINECSSKIVAVDGADNKQEKIDKKIVVNKKGKFKNGVITVYWYDDFENRFVKWDASSYGQENPIVTNSTDGYSLMLPKGKYYIEAKSAGKRTTVSNILDLKSAAIINDDWELNPLWKFWQFTEEKKITPKVLGSSKWEDVSDLLPNVKLVSSDNTAFSTLDLRGHISILGITTTWYPSTNDYLKFLEDVKNNGVYVVPVMLQEKSSLVSFLKRRGGYKLDIYSDQDGELLKDLNINELPITLIIDKHGKILKQKVGLFNSKDDLLQEIAKTY